MAFFRRPVRSRPIRLFLIIMFAVPLVSLLALWGFAASITVSNAVSDHEYNVSAAAIASGVRGLIIGLPQERVQSYLWLTSGRTTPKADMLAARHLVDQGIPAVRAALNAQRGQLSAQSRSELNTLFTELGQLGTTRAAIDSGAMSTPEAFGAYSTIIDHLFLYFDTSIQDRGASLTGISVGASDSGYAFEMTTREIALVAGALLDRGQMSQTARTLFASSVANRRLLMSESLALMTSSLRAGYVSLENSPAYRQFQTMESQILASTGGVVPVNASDWQSASQAVVGAMEKTQLDNGNQLTAMSASLSDRLVTEAVLAGGLGLVAVVASVFLLVWFGRKVTRDLGGLNDSVREMAAERLPRVVERLRRGEDVNVAAESPAPGASTIREISRIAESFGTVQGAAVAAAVDQARLRKGVNQVFLNISMRNQSLLHRQLGMLDSMERRTSEPEALADLFRIDHLTTRMRRHAEGLIILSGAVPGRGWRDPVPVVDVLRAAVAEVEDYVRVDVTSESDELVAGNAVNDVIHLVAELIENAAAFSPPNTRIEVRAERVGNGLVAEVEDRGLGLPAEELADINRRLESSQEFDLAASEQLGLFVVRRLAERHDIRVSLRRSVYGGTTAVVLLPFGVVVRKEEAGPPIEQASATRSLTGRHRLLPAIAPAPAITPGRGTGEAAAARPGEREWPPASLAYPLAPWETAPQPLSAAAPAAPSAPATPPAAAAPHAPTAPQAAVSAAAPTWWDDMAAPWPGAFQPGISRREPARPGTPGEDAPPRSPRALERPGPASSDSHLGMPIRVPQASLAPQLQRHRDGDPQTAAEPGEPGIDPRSPEATRSMLASMQQGWRRGRVDDLDSPGGAPGNGAPGNGTDR
jgi:signal transduction histidine kinase